MVACDQYTSQPEYWQRVERFVGTAPSALHLILPESSLDGPNRETISSDGPIPLSRYLRDGIFGPASPSSLWAHTGVPARCRRAGGHGGSGGVRL
ncbi:MAG: DUF1015 family protein [Intestinimonas sp.]